MTWIILNLLLFYIYSFYSHLIFYKFLILSHILSWKSDYFLSLFYILPSNSNFGWWIIVFFKTLFWVNTYWCCIFEYSITSTLSSFYSFGLILFELILSYFGSDNWNYIKTQYWLWIWVCLYLCNIECNFVMIFYYHDNLI